MRVVRTGPLTWGQHMFWFYNDPWRDGPDIPRPESRRRLVVPPLTSRSHFQDVVNRCVNRFEALRTVYSRPGSGPPQQRVIASYEPPLMAPKEAIGRTVSIFDRPSIRFLVKTDGAAITDAELRVNKLDVDGYSLHIVKRLIEAELRPDDDTPPVAFNAQIHPIDWAVHESERLAGRSARSVAWMRELRSLVPRNHLPVRRGAGARRRTTVTVRTPHLFTALEELARHCGVTVASVVHAVIALLLSVREQRSDMYLHTVLANRWEPESREMVGRVAMAVALRIPVDRAQTADEFLALTHRVLLTAYRHSRRNFDTCRMTGIRDDAEYGSTLTLPVVVEYFGFQQGTGSSAHPSDTVDWTVLDGGTDQVRFEVAPVGTGMRINLTADTWALSTADAITAATLVADLLRALIRQPDVSLDRLARAVTLLPSDVGDLVPLNGSRFDPTLAAERLRDCPGVERAAVFMDDTDPSPVRAHIAGTGVGLVEVHEHMMLAAASDPLIRVPTTYRLVATAPADPGSEASWLRCPDTGELRPSDGYRRSPDDNGPLRALIEVFEANHPGRIGDPTRCYAAAGGEYILVPALMVGLHASGFTGAAAADFIGLASLAAIAGKLRPVSPPSSD
jgi:hypothetical protein